MHYYTPSKKWYAPNIHYYLGVYCVKFWLQVYTVVPKYTVKLSSTPIILPVNIVLHNYTVNLSSKHIILSDIGSNIGPHSLTVAAMGREVNYTLCVLNSVYSVFNSVHSVLNSVYSTL